MRCSPSSFWQPWRLVGLFVFCLPFAHVTGLRHLLALVLVAGVGLKCAPRAGALSLPALLWVGISLLSAAWSVLPWASFSDALTSAALPVALGVGMLFLPAHDREPAWIGKGLLLGLGVLLLIRFAYLGAPAGTRPEGLYAYWPGRGVLSSICVLCLPFAIWLWGQRYRYLGAGLFVLALLAGAQNWNRMFWVAAVLTLLPCLFMYPVGRRVRWMLGGPVLLALGCGGYWAMYVMRDQVAGPLAPGFLEDPRWLIWREWLQLVPDAPWFGHGYGPRATAQVGQTLLPAMPDAHGLSHPHNLFLSILIQTGMAGLLAYGAALLDLGRRFWHCSRQIASRPAAVAGLATLVALVSKNLTDDFNYHGPAFLFWLLVGFFARRAGFARACP